VPQQENCCSGDRRPHEDAQRPTLIDVGGPDTIPPPDVVELALAAALDRTSDPDTIADIVTELRARREARARVISLDAARAKRGGK
jgi:hypothetical protein